jgi:hypothetical protein
MAKKNTPKENIQTSAKNVGSKSPANGKTNMDQRDAAEDQHGKGGSGRKSNEESEDQDANQKGFGEDE